MKLWTFGEVRQKLERDCDLEDETFITRDELVGYYNEGIDAAEAEIQKLNEDYFLTSASIDLTLGQSAITLPTDIYAQKIRSLIFSNGSEMYEVSRIRGSKKFIDLTDVNLYRTAEWYRYVLKNGTAGGQSTILLVPPSRETLTAALTLWYIRNAQRIPLLGEYAIDKTVSSVSAAANTLSVTAHGLATGDMLKVSSTLTVPTGLTAGTIYYAIKVDADTIKLATSLLNAKLGTAIDITGAGTGTITATLAVTEDLQDAVVIDIPEFSSFLIQFAKVRCYEKEPDPRYDSAVIALAAHQKQMVDTLSERVVDNDNTVELDLSHYNEHN
jgi:hypothetical protein